MAHKFPSFLVGDEIFPVKLWLMRPYPEKLPEEEGIYKYRYSGARRVIENDSLVGDYLAILSKFCTSLFLPSQLYLPNRKLYVYSFWFCQYLNRRWKNKTKWTGIMVTEEARCCVMSISKALKTFSNLKAGLVPWQLDYVKSVGEESERNWRFKYVVLYIFCSAGNRNKK